MGWNDPRTHYVGPDCTPMSSQPAPPTLLMRVAEIHNAINDIDGVLDGTDGEARPPLVQAAVPGKTEEAMALIGDSLDKAHARLVEMRLRLLEHVRRLR